MPDLLITGLFVSLALYISFHFRSRVVLVSFLLRTLKDNYRIT